MFNDLIEYEDLQEACAESFGFSGVTFKRDFGPYKKGDKVASLWFNLEDGTWATYLEDWETMVTPDKTGKYQLIAIS